MFHVSHWYPTRILRTITLPPQCRIWQLIPDVAWWTHWTAAFFWWSTIYSSSQGWQALSLSIQLLQMQMKSNPILKPWYIKISTKKTRTYWIRNKQKSSSTRLFCPLKNCQHLLASEAAYRCVVLTSCAEHDERKTSGGWLLNRRRHNDHYLALNG